MRHGDKINNLGRTASHRSALLSNLASQLITHKRIVTTLAKAKSVKDLYRAADHKWLKKILLTSAELYSAIFRTKKQYLKLFGSVAEKVAGRPGGYTRIIKLGMRSGDAAETAMIELVDFNDIYGKGKGESKEAGKRTRRSGGKKKAEGKETEATASKEKEEAKKEKSAE